MGRTLPAARTPGNPPTISPKVTEAPSRPGPSAGPPSSELTVVHPLSIVEPEGGSRKVWDRIPREADAAWTMFLAFRDMAYPEGPSGRFAPRHLTTLASALGVNVRTVEAYSAQFNWFHRAGEFDRALDSAKTEADFSEARRTRLRHIRLLGKARLALESELDRWLARLGGDPEHSSMSPREVMQGLELVIKSERLVQGEHTDHVKVDGEWDLDSLTMEDLEGLDQIRRRAKGRG